MAYNHGLICLVFPVVKWGDYSEITPVLAAKQLSFLVVFGNEKCQNQKQQGEQYTSGALLDKSFSVTLKTKDPVLGIEGLVGLYHDHIQLKVIF